MCNVCNLHGVFLDLLKPIPQAIFWPLRTALIERSEAASQAAAQASAAASDEAVTSNSAAVAGAAACPSAGHLGEVMGCLRRWHGPLALELEGLAAALCGGDAAFAPRAEEELLGCLTGLHAKALVQTRAARDDPLPAPATAHLRAIYAHFFPAAGDDESAAGVASTATAATGAAAAAATGGRRKAAGAALSSDGRMKDDASGGASGLVAVYGGNDDISAGGVGALKEAFERDFLSAGLTLGSALVSLGAWRRALAQRRRLLSAARGGGGGSRSSQQPLALAAPILAAFRQDHHTGGYVGAGYSFSSASSSSSSSSSLSSLGLEADVSSLSPSAMSPPGTSPSELSPSAQLVEVPGQYHTQGPASGHRAPQPQLHAKVLRFGPVVEALAPTAAGTSRRVSVLGSDGVLRRFIVQVRVRLLFCSLRAV